MHFSTRNAKLSNTIKLIKSDNPLYEGLPTKYLVWGVPAFRSATGFKTCPGASACSGPCFARSGHYTFTRRKELENENLRIARKHDFRYRLNERLQSLNKPHIIRIHDSGDFFSKQYFLDWLWAATQNPRHLFYAYTKSWYETSLHRVHLQEKRLTPNFRLTYSLGGKHDDNILTYNQLSSMEGSPRLPISKIFLSDEHAWSDHYTPSHTDIQAIQGFPRIGLIYHNNKHARNFKWNEQGALYNAALYNDLEVNHFKEENVQ